MSENNEPGLQQAVDPHADLAGYVLDALDPTERAAFETHLAACPSCPAEVDAFRSSLADLDAALDEAPPARLRSSVLDAIAATATATSLPESSAPVISLADVRARRVARVSTLAVAAALVIALALGGWVVQLRGQLDQQRQLSAAQQQVAQARQLADAELLTAPDVTFYPLKPSDGTAVYVVSKQLNRAQLVGTELKPLDGGDRVYQLWTGGSGPTFVSAGTFTVSGGTFRVQIAGNIADASLLAITDEPSNGGRGSSQPTTQPFGDQAI